MTQRHNMQRLDGAPADASAATGRPGRKRKRPPPDQQQQRGSQADPRRHLDSEAQQQQWMLHQGLQVAAACQSSASSSAAHRSPLLVLSVHSVDAAEDISSWFDQDMCCRLSPVPAAGTMSPPPVKREAVCTAASPDRDVRDTAQAATPVRQSTSVFDGGRQPSAAGPFSSGDCITPAPPTLNQHPRSPLRNLMPPPLMRLPVTQPRQCPEQQSPSGRSPDAAGRRSKRHAPSSPPQQSPPYKTLDTGIISLPPPLSPLLSLPPPSPPHAAAASSGGSAAHQDDKESEDLLTVPPPSAAASLISASQQRPPDVHAAAAPRQQQEDAESALQVLPASSGPASDEPVAQPAALSTNSPPPSPPPPHCQILATSVPAQHALASPSSPAAPAGPAESAVLAGESPPPPHLPLSPARAADECVIPETQGGALLHSQSLPPSPAAASPLRRAPPSPPPFSCVEDSYVSETQQGASISAEVWSPLLTGCSPAAAAAAAGAAAAAAAAAAAHGDAFAVGSPQPTAGASVLQLTSAEQSPCSGPQSARGELAEESQYVLPLHSPRRARGGIIMETQFNEAEGEASQDAAAAAAAAQQRLPLPSLWTSMDATLPQIVDLNRYPEAAPLVRAGARAAAAAAAEAAAAATPRRCEDSLATCGETMPASFEYSPHSATQTQADPSAAAQEQHERGDDTRATSGAGAPPPTPPRLTSMQTEHASLPAPERRRTMPLRLPLRDVVTPAAPIAAAAASATRSSTVNPYKGFAHTLPGSAGAAANPYAKPAGAQHSSAMRGSPARGSPYAKPQRSASAQPSPMRGSPTALRYGVPSSAAALATRAGAVRGSLYARQLHDSPAAARGEAAPPAHSAAGRRAASPSGGVLGAAAALTPAAEGASAAALLPERTAGGEREAIAAAAQAGGARPRSGERGGGNSVAAAAPQMTPARLAAGRPAGGFASGSFTLPRRAQAPAAVPVASGAGASGGGFARAGTGGFKAPRAVRAPNAVAKAVTPMHTPASSAGVRPPSYAAGGGMGAARATSTDGGGACGGGGGGGAFAAGAAASAGGGGAGCSGGGGASAVRTADGSATPAATRQGAAQPSPFAPFLSRQMIEGTHDYASCGGGGSAGAASPQRQAAHAPAAEAFRKPAAQRGAAAAADVVTPAQQRRPSRSCATAATQALTPTPQAPLAAAAMLSTGGRGAVAGGAEAAAELTRCAAGCDSAAAASATDSAAVLNPDASSTIAGTRGENMQSTLRERQHQAVGGTAAGADVAAAAPHQAPAASGGLSFKRGRGKTVSISDSAVQQAKQRLEQHEAGAGTASADAAAAQVPQPAAAPGASGGLSFKRGSGATVSISDSAVQQAKQRLEQQHVAGAGAAVGDAAAAQLPQPAAAPGASGGLSFKRGSGATVSVSDSAVQQAKQRLEQHETGAGGTDGDAAAAQLLQPAAASGASRGVSFKRGSGATVSVSDSAVQQAKQRLEQHEAGAGTAGADAAAAQVPQPAAAPGASGGLSFKHGSGATVSISNSAVQQAKQRLEQQHEAGVGAAVGGAVAEELPQPAAAGGASGGLSFKRGSGATVSVSDSAVQQAKHRLEQHEASAGAAIGGAVAEELRASAAASGGVSFKRGHGKSVSVSDSAMQEARRRLEQGDAGSSTGSDGDACVGGGSVSDVLRTPRAAWAGASAAAATADARAARSSVSPDNSRAHAASMDKALQPASSLASASAGSALLPAARSGGAASSAEHSTPQQQWAPRRLSCSSSTPASGAAAMGMPPPAARVRLMNGKGDASGNAASGSSSGGASGGGGSSGAHRTEQEPAGARAAEAQQQRQQLRRPLSALGPPRPRAERGDCARQLAAARALQGQVDRARAALIEGGARPDSAPPAWVRNHLRWIVWKLASMAAAWPAALGGYVTWARVMEQLRYRCTLPPQLRRQGRGLPQAAKRTCPRGMPNSGAVAQAINCMHSSAFATERAFATESAHPSTAAHEQCTTDPPPPPLAIKSARHPPLRINSSRLTPPPPPSPCARPAAAAATTSRLRAAASRTYDVEVARGRKPHVRAILQGDAAAELPCVLCVASLDPPVLTDGWYAVDATLDRGLAFQAQRGRLRVGDKLAVAGGVLLCSNSTRRARWDARLGRLRSRDGAPPPLLIPLCAAFADGGLITATEVVVLRLYPVQYMETLEEGGGAAEATSGGGPGGSGGGDGAAAAPPVRRRQRVLSLAEEEVVAAAHDRRLGALLEDAALDIQDEVTEILEGDRPEVLSAMMAAGDPAAYFHALDEEQRAEVLAWQDQEPSYADKQRCRLIERHRRKAPERRSRPFVTASVACACVAPRAGHAPCGALLRVFQPQHVVETLAEGRCVYSRGLQRFEVSRQCLEFSPRCAPCGVLLRVFQPSQHVVETLAEGRCVYSRGLRRFGVSRQCLGVSLRYAPCGALLRAFQPRPHVVKTLAEGSHLLLHRVNAREGRGGAALQLDALRSTAIVVLSAPAPQRALAAARYAPRACTRLGDMVGALTGLSEGGGGSGGGGGGGGGASFDEVDVVGAVLQVVRLDDPHRGGNGSSSSAQHRLLMYLADSSLSVLCLEVRASPELAAHCRVFKSAPFTCYALSNIGVDRYCERNGMLRGRWGEHTLTAGTAAGAPHHLTEPLAQLKAWGDSEQGRRALQLARERVLALQQGA
ncbi:hypothetical protein JKP88DRAFT_264879 [Tribonema minus]|uniref:Uncharacterized protein n=1 Tax=Tribonema minus TaxID=303371 RepID=A0A835YWB0_9STRA|nr:hypothetical protein JKP88DRAFT_264879 [Tribonema minus]